jgi:hypothetical protein
VVEAAAIALSRDDCSSKVWIIYALNNLGNGRRALPIGADLNENSHLTAGGENRFAAPIVASSWSILGLDDSGTERQEPPAWVDAVGNRHPEAGGEGGAEACGRRQLPRSAG